MPSRTRARRSLADNQRIKSAPFVGGITKMTRGHCGYGRAVGHLETVATQCLAKMLLRRWTRGAIEALSRLERIASHCFTVVDSERHPPRNPFIGVFSHPPPSDPRLILRPQPRRPTRLYTAWR